MRSRLSNQRKLIFLPPKSFFWTPLLIWDIQPAWRQQTFQLDAIFCVLFPLLNFVFLEVPAHRSHCGVLANFTMLLCKFQLDINIIFFSETRMPSPTSALLRILFVCGGRVFCFAFWSRSSHRFSPVNTLLWSYKGLCLCCLLLPGFPTWPGRYSDKKPFK